MRLFLPLRFQLLLMIPLLGTFPGPSLRLGPLNGVGKDGLLGHLEGRDPGATLEQSEAREWDRRRRRARWRARGWARRRAWGWARGRDRQGDRRGEERGASGVLWEVQSTALHRGHLGCRQIPAQRDEQRLDRT